MTRTYVPEPKTGLRHARSQTADLCHGELTRGWRSSFWPVPNRLRVGQGPPNLGTTQRRIDRPSAEPNSGPLDWLAFGG